MQVILLQDINKLGKKGDIKNVADGYVLNFLLPKKLVMKANGKKIENIKKQLQKKEKDEVKVIEKYKKIINKLSNVELIIKAKASANGKLFAAINEKDIIEELIKQKKINFNKDNIKLDKHLKNIGKYEVPINFGNDLATKIIIKIIKDE